MTQSREKVYEAAAISSIIVLLTFLVFAAISITIRDYYAEKFTEVQQCMITPFTRVIRSDGKMRNPVKYQSILVCDGKGSVVINHVSYEILSVGETYAYEQKWVKDNWQIDFFNTGTEVSLLISGLSLIVLVTALILL